MGVIIRENDFGFAGAYYDDKIVGAVTRRVYEDRSRAYAGWPTQGALLLRRRFAGTKEHAADL